VSLSPLTQAKITEPVASVVASNPAGRFIISEQNLSRLIKVTQRLRTTPLHNVSEHLEIDLANSPIALRTLMVRLNLPSALFDYAMLHPVWSWKPREFSDHTACSIADHLQSSEDLLSRTVRITSRSKVRKYSEETVPPIDKEKVCKLLSILTEGTKVHFFATASLTQHLSEMSTDSTTYFKKHRRNFKALLDQIKITLQEFELQNLSPLTLSSPVCQVAGLFTQALRSSLDPYPDLSAVSDRKIFIDATRSHNMARYGTILLLARTLTLRLQSDDFFQYTEQSLSA
jgi:hypothetical protein